MVFTDLRGKEVAGIEILKMAYLNKFCKDILGLYLFVSMLEACYLVHFR